MKVKLTDICTPKQWKTVPTSKLLEDGYPVYGANGIIGYYNEYNHENPVVAITCRGATCGTINITVPRSYVTGNAMCLDNVCSDVLTEYLYYCLLHYDFKNVISGSAQPQITRQGLEKVTIKLCTVDNQQEIITILGKIKGIIVNRQQQLEKLDELVKARFVEMFGDPIDNTRGLMMMPLGKACFLKAGITTAADSIHERSAVYNIPCYGGNGVRGYVKEATQCGCYPIIGRQGALCGNVQMATGEFHATEHAVLVTPLIEMNVVWLFNLLKLMDLYRFHTGAAQPGLAVKTLNTVDIPIADIVMQNQFAAFVAQVDKSKVVVQKEIKQLIAVIS